MLRLDKQTGAAHPMGVFDQWSSMMQTIAAMRSNAADDDWTHALGLAQDAHAMLEAENPAGNDWRLIVSVARLPHTREIQHTSGVASPIYVRGRKSH